MGNIDIDKGQEIVASFTLKKSGVISAKFVDGDDHEQLYNREKPNQHPIEAITDLKETLDLKQNLLINGTNIKTVNGQNLLGSGNIDGGLVDDVKVNNNSVVVNKIADIKLKTINSQSIVGEGNIEGGLVNDVMVNGTSVVTNKTANVVVPTKTSDLNNDSGYITKDVNNLDYYTKTSDLATVATTGNYTDLNNKPTIGNGTLIIQKNSSSVGTFTANSTTNTTINIEVPTKVSNLINDSNYQTQSEVNTAISTHNSSTVAHSDIRQDISGIEELIPAQATSENKLADKEFVNSSISNNTANFIGTFANVSQLNAYSGTITNNDYAFVINSVVTNNGSDWATLEQLNTYNKALLTNFDYAWIINGSKFDLYRFDIVEQKWNLRVSNTTKEEVTLNTAYNRYKAVVSDNNVSWNYEYTLNNSSFTSSQWAAINSGITTEKVTSYDNHLNNTSNPHSVTKAQVGLGNVDNTSDLDKPISTATQEALDAKQVTLVSGTNIKTVNGNTVLGSGNLELSTYQTFNSNWPTSSTFIAFMTAIKDDSSAVEGMAYLGELTCSGLPEGLVNVEAVVEIMKGSTANTKVIHVTLTSGNLQPYRWEYTYWNGGSNVSGWIGFQPALNEFIITKEIYEKYKEEIYDGNELADEYVNLKSVMQNENVIQDTINLNNYKCIISKLTISNKKLIIKNGTIKFNNENVITASSCDITFKDCIIYTQQFTEHDIGEYDIAYEQGLLDYTVPSLDINNTNITFDNVIADTLMYISKKKFIQTTSNCNIVLKDCDFELANLHYRMISYETNDILFLNVLTDGTAIKFVDSAVIISNDNSLVEDVPSNNSLAQHRVIITTTNVDAKIDIINSIISGNGSYDEIQVFGITVPGPMALNVNIDNTDINTINSSIIGENNIRLQDSKYALKKNETYSSNKEITPYLILRIPSIDIFDGDDEEEEYEPTFETIDCNKYVFSEKVEYKQGLYNFVYDAEHTQWDLQIDYLGIQSELPHEVIYNVDLEEYGITYTLLPDKSLEEGVYIGIQYTIDDYKSFKVYETFTATDNSEDYVATLSFPIKRIHWGMNIDTVDCDRAMFGKAMNDVFVEAANKRDSRLTNNRKLHHYEFTWVEEEDSWVLRVYLKPNVEEEETEPSLYYEELVNLEDFGITYTLKSGEELVNGTEILVEPNEPTLSAGWYTQYIKGFVGNSINDPEYRDYRYYFFFYTMIAPFRMNNSIATQTIYSQNLYNENSITTKELQVESEDYQLPIESENLESNNVKDAIIELADKQITETNAGFSIDINKEEIEEDGEEQQGKLKINYLGIGVVNAKLVFDDEEEEYSNEVDFTNENIHVSEGSLIFMNGQLLDVYTDYSVDNDKITFNNIEFGDILSIINGWNIFNRISGFEGESLYVNENIEQRTLIFKNGDLLAQNFDYTVNNGHEITFFTTINSDDKLFFVRTTNEIIRDDSYTGTEIGINSKELLIFKGGILLNEDGDYVIEENEDTETQEENKYVITFEQELDDSVVTIIIKDAIYGIFNTLSNKQDLLTQDQLNNINTPPYRPTTFINVVADSWQADNTYNGYGYKCDLYCEGVNENMYAQVVFSVAEANSGNYATVCETTENTVTIYSKVNDTITIPTIVVMEA